MDGTKNFINNTGLHLKVVLTVRSGERPGCVYRVEEFCLCPGERKCVEYGSKCNPFLDGIRVFSDDRGGCTETALFVTGCGCTSIDKLLNKNRDLIFLRAAQSLVISSPNCGRC